MIDDVWALFWGFAIIVVASFILTWVHMDNKITNEMAQKGYCYSAVDRTNHDPTFMWQKCK